MVLRAAELHPEAARLGSARLLGIGSRLQMMSLPVLQPPQASFLAGVDLLSLDGKHAVLCRTGNATQQDVKRFLRTANCICKAARSPTRF